MPHFSATNLLGQANWGQFRVLSYIPSVLSLFIFFLIILTMTKVTSAAAQLLTDVAMEASGLSSAKRIFDSDIKPYLGRRNKAKRGRFRSKSRGRPLTSRMEQTENTTTRQRGDLVNYFPIAPRTLSRNEISWPQQGAGVGDRLGSTIRVSGIKYCEQFYNPLDIPVVVHFAIIQPKDPISSLNTDFFRSTISSVRGVPFVDAGSTNPYEFAYDCFPINPTTHNVLLHKRKVLSSNNATANPMWDTWKFDGYINLKGMRFTFDNATDTSPSNPIYRVAWWQPLRYEDWPADPTTLGNISQMEYACVYFKNGFS